MSAYENTTLINREREQLLVVAKKLGHESELLGLLADPKTPLNPDIEWRVNLNHEVAQELIQEKEKKGSGLGNQATESSGQLSMNEKQSQTSAENPHYQSFLAMQEEMANDNKLSDADMEAIKDIPYLRETNPAGIVIHTFGDLAPVAIPDYDKIKLRYSDMDHKTTGTRALEHLAESEKFKSWNENLGASKITFEPGVFERMRDHFFAIATLIARKMGINDTIDVEFFDNKDNKSKYDRIGRALRIITGQTFVMLYKIDSETGLVSSLGCGHGVVLVGRGNYDFGSDVFAPFLMFRSSL